MANNNENKVMSAEEAIRRFVNDGDELIIGNYTVGTCIELVCEICRQEKKGFTLYSQSGILDVDILINAGCVDRLVTTYTLRSGGKKGGGALERALQAGTVEIEDYTNYNYNARLVAGMHGFSFMQVFEGIMVTDLFKKRSFMGDDKYRVITCPYTGKQVVTVPAANPDVCIVHVPRADKYGNAQYWGSMGSVADAHSCRGFSCATDLFSAFTMTYRGFVDVCFLGVGQIDKYGNLNTTCIGDYYKPTLRLPGSGGAADFISYAKRTVLTLRGGEFVEKLDYFTSPGYLDGGDSRDQSGLFPKGSGPTMLLTTKGVFRFDEETKELYLAQIHPGVTVEDITKEIPWDVKVSPDLEETLPPSDREIDFVRRFAPTESVGRALTMELSIKATLNRSAGNDTR